MTTTQMIESSADEVIYLFEVMEKYGVRCSMDINIHSLRDPFGGIVNQPVSVDYFESEDGDAVIVSLGESEFSFEVGSHSYSKYITTNQIMICIAGEHHVAWFNSQVVPADGIVMAGNYQKLYGELEVSEVDLNLQSDDFESELSDLCNLLREGKVIKNVNVIGDGEQIVTVGFLGEDKL